MTALIRAVGAALSSAPDGPLGVAVSGGSDSLALLFLVHECAARPLYAVTVDHGLRHEAAAEALAVAGICANLGVPHTILRWQDWDGAGNLQASARQARQALIADWAHGNDLAMVALGHTLDDQAETFLQRLARGSGVDGLAAMSAQRALRGIIWLRPLLTVQRADLQDYLRTRGIAWASDPSNDDDSYSRVRFRKAQPQLDDLGLTQAVLAKTAGQMARAREALEYATLQLAESVALASTLGIVTLHRAGYAQAPLELRLRVLAGALGWVGGQVYRPRLDQLAALDQHILADAVGRCLHGVQLLPDGDPDGDKVILCRELAGQPVETLGDDQNRVIWDNRWLLRGAFMAGDQIAPLGAEGLALCSDWRDSGWPRAVLMVTPGLWRQGKLIAAPMLVPVPEYRCALVGGAKGFYDALMTR